MSNLWERIVNTFFQFAPSCTVCLSFLPCGLTFGYTIASFVAERNLDRGSMAYGPLILGGCAGLACAVTMCVVKFLRQRIIFWHINILLGAAVLHLLGSCFYFFQNMDKVGSFISYLAYSIIFVAGLSFLHSILGRCMRSILLSLSSCFFLMGVALAVTLISSRYGLNITEQPNASEGQLAEGIYMSFAGVYVAVAMLLLILLIVIKVLAFLGNVDCETCMDNEFRIANSNGSIFDKRADIIKRIQFFYVTKNQQWNVTLLLLFTEAIHYALFIYFVFWFSLNKAVQLTEVEHVDQLYWVIFLGSLAATLSLIFYSAKVMFVVTRLCLIAMAIVAMVLYSKLHTAAAFWMTLFFFGVSYANLQIVLVEVTHFRYTELLIYASYGLKLLCCSGVYYYYVVNARNSFFYATDESTLMAQGFVFIIISALLALVVGMKVPRTHNTSLFNIQYGLLGIIFQKHQIEQLNVKWLNDGTIPTVAAPEEERY